jgi:capsular polysaccharide export protein
MDTVLFNHAHERDKVKFFTVISNLLSKKDFNTIHLAFSKEELTNYSMLGIQSIFMPKELKMISQKETTELINGYNLDELIAYTVEFNKKNKYKISINNLKTTAQKYLFYLEELRKDVSLELIIIWNDTFLFDALAKAFAIKNQIPYRVFEAGLFRPNTITIDPIGVNANNSVPRKRSFYEDVNINEKEINNIRMIDIDLPNSSASYIHNRFVDFVCTKTGRQEDTRIIYESMFNKILRRLKSKASSNKMSISMKNEYIFVPFQVKDDSQIIQNSPIFKSMFDLVSFLVSEIKIWNKNNNDNLHIVFKEHPADTTNYHNLYQKFSSNDNVIFLREGDTQELIRNSKLVITINSTVGLEAIGQFKKVLTLGEAFYNIEGIAVHCKVPSEFQQCLNKAISNGIDDRLINNFLSYLRNEYQLVGNWREGKFNENQMMKKLGLMKYE